MTFSKRIFLRAACLCLLAGIFSATGTTVPPAFGGRVTREARDVPPEVSGLKPDGEVGLVQETKATFYPGRQAGRQGHANAAASNLYPKGSILEVTNLENSRKVTLIVNDDGFFRRQIRFGGKASFKESSYEGPRGVGIDLNPEAARAIGMMQTGIVAVRVVRVR